MVSGAERFDLSDRVANFRSEIVGAIHGDSDDELLPHTLHATNETFQANSFHALVDQSSLIIVYPTNMFGIAISPESSIATPKVNSK